jgi:hypothetical protein
MDVKMNKKGQITIFIILGLILVVGFALVFLLINPPEAKIIDDKNPTAFIETCTQEAVEEAIEIISRSGGDINPRGFLKYKDEDITYLCYTNNLYFPCTTQRPLLIEHIESEITNHITPIIADCFFKLKEKTEKTHTVETSGINLITTLHTQSVAVKIDKKFKMTRKGESIDINTFRMRLVHPIYDLAKIAMEITNQESKYCNFDELGYMILHPEYDITKFITGNANIIYGVRDISTNQEFKFAIRSCRLPEGY